MSPTLAADDRTVIPIYAGLQVYYTSNHKHATRLLMKMNTRTWS